MPIQGISEIRRYPRLGKIHLGIKKEGQKGPYPAATDHFVVPEEVQKIYGEKPTELDVMFPSEKLELFAPQWYKAYSYSQGKICQGDGKTCRRKVDTDTGDFAGKDTKNFVWVETICDPPHCPMIGDKQCRRVMSLMFLLPKVPGLGIYQLDTSSFYSIVNINSQLAEDGFLRYFTNGRISNIPLKLSLVPQEVNPLGAGRKTVYVLNVRAELKLSEIIELSGKSVAQVLLPPVEDSEPPEDLYPGEILQQAEEKHEPSPEAYQSIKAPAVFSTTSSAPAGLPQKEVQWEDLGRDRKEIEKAEEVRGSKSVATLKSSQQIERAPNSSREEVPPEFISTVKPREEWEKITRKDVSGYLDLEMIYCRLTGKSNREMYRELGGGTRTDQTIPAWDAFLNLKHNYWPKD